MLTMNIRSEERHHANVTAGDDSGTITTHHHHHHHQLIIPSFRSLKFKCPEDTSSVCKAMTPLGVDETMQPVKRDDDEDDDNNNANDDDPLAKMPSSSLKSTTTRRSPTTSNTNNEHASPRKATIQQPRSPVPQEQQHKQIQQLPSVPERMPPKIPPRSPITNERPRSVSESGTSSSCRRAIFGKYWDQGKSHNSVATVVEGERCLSGGGNHLLKLKDPTTAADFNVTKTPPPPNRVRKRSSSMTIIDSHGSVFDPEPLDYRMFAPPKEHADHSSICGRFASVEDVPTPMMGSLPPLPSPLRRFCVEGDHSPGCLHGMYPLMTPIPILRQSSYRSLLDDKRKNGGDSSKARRPASWYGTTYGQGSFNLTESWRPDRAVSFDAASSTSTSSDQSSSSGIAPKTGVRFDPRVTVTEFEDPVERCWYNDIELDHLKYETIVLAQEYLLTHPDKAERYNRAILDPVTGTYRKKALFSLPILSTNEDEAIPSPDHKEYEALVKSQVKTILIVDPNKAILDLFCKSMYSMFPSAELFKTQSGDEALQLVSTNLQRGGSVGAPRSFDIIIVEQRLFQPQVANVESTKAKSLLGLSERGGTVPFLEIHKPSSFSEAAQCAGALSHIGMCGSQLLKIVQRLEDDAFAESTPSSSLNSSSSSSSSLASSSNNLEVSLPSCGQPIQRKSLLIGVSMQPDHDAKDFQAAGADLVWGKPIPRVGEALRNQLLHTLVNKRRRSLTDGKPQIEDETI